MRRVTAFSFFFSFLPHSFLLSFSLSLPSPIPLVHHPTFSLSPPLAPVPPLLLRSILVVRPLFTCKPSHCPTVPPSSPHHLITQSHIERPWPYGKGKDFLSPRC
ncbi:MAG: hypothetical protein J3Q66DRAFT_204420 [Benniella sp.]|nr:MAG: hypothetical protein J3Q66DRAFT_204420 [Benniella sp.]